MLKLYKKKRNFKDTPEPKGQLSSKNHHLFVVQKHDATRLHYDFRLEMDGVLKSWVIPKEFSMNPRDRRLAVQVEDHPYSYHDFEGVIPEGNYGAGTVMVWDTGTYELLKREPHEIIFNLHGKKLKGQFTLVHMKDGNNWLLIKNKDDYTSDKPLGDDRSALSSKTMDEINPASLGKKSKMPTLIKPMLAYLIDKPFEGDEWLFEIKWDGYRAIAEVDKSEVHLYSRTFQNFNMKFKPIVEALKELNQRVIVDGEVVILDKDGRSSFQDLQNYQKTGEGNLYYAIFDLLYYQGRDLRQVPLEERKELLKSLIPKKGPLIYSDHIDGNGIKFFEKAVENKLEGIIAKKKNSLYKSSRSRDWLKIKVHARQEFVIGGFTEPKGSRKDLGALLVGVYKDKDLIFSGHVGGGFNQKMLKDIKAKLEPLIISKCPFKTVPKTNTKAAWVKPKLICEVSYSELTKEGIMRQPIFAGLREDKKPREVSRETNVDKVFFPEDGYTKGDLIQYYSAMSKYILPYLKERPESLRRFPNGIQEEGFFQKNVDFKENVPTVPIEQHGKTVNYLLIPDKKTLLFTINLGCIDLNPFNSRVKTIDYPDYMVLDLDPEDISFDKVVEAALTLHDILESASIPNYCKTSGKRGMHIYVPMGAKYTYEQVKEFAHLISEIGHSHLPSITSVERSPKNRQKKVYLDYLQNNFGQTVAAPYSVRPYPGATVSTPLKWSEVKKGLDPSDFTIRTVPKRVEKIGDIFGDVLKKGIDIKKALTQLGFKGFP